MKFGLSDGRQDDVHTGIGFVEISKILAMQDAIFFEPEPFDKVYNAVLDNRPTKPTPNA